jgi:hypothetical protein
MFKFMNKVFTWIIVGLFLVIIPIGSWYYLNQGLQYRKNLLKEMEIKSGIDSQADSLGFLMGSANVVVLRSTDETQKIAGQLKEQFDNSPRFNIYFKDSIEGFASLPVGYMADEWNSMSGNSFVLLDTLMNVRNTYSTDMESVKKLVEHITVVIPRQKEPDIKIKSN